MPSAPNRSLSSDSSSELVKRLNILILLQLEGYTDTTAAKIEKLSAYGLSSAETANIIGRPMKYVSAVVAKGKRRSERKLAK